MITVFTGVSRKDKNWKKKTFTWNKFKELFRTPKRTEETYNAFLQMPKARQDDVKDIGGFVGGELSGPRRTAENVLSRSIITLDIDNAEKTFWPSYEVYFEGSAGFLYSTHKHHPERPRYRLIIPLSREVDPEEYEAVSRKIAERLGIEQFDATTFEPSRLMYWACASKDGVYEFREQLGDECDPDQILSLYTDWTDRSSWASPSSEEALKLKIIKNQEHPTLKKGLIGAFCNTYTIPEVIDSFLVDVYQEEPTGRYTYREGTTTGGVIIYDDVFAYSHHSTDPTTGKLLNAFDLLRLHKYRNLDFDVKDETPAHKYPSFIRLTEELSQDPRIKKYLHTQSLESAQEDFKGLSIQSDKQIDPDWSNKLEYDKKGNVTCTIENFSTILKNDPYFDLRYDTFNHFELDGVHEITDMDTAAYELYIERVYKIFHSAKFDKGFKTALSANKFNPVRDYLDSLVWDGVPRVETLFIDYLGVEETPYARQTARKMLAACAKRIYEPGCKMDYCMVLQGDQGDNKSQLLHILGGAWFSDSIFAVQGKDAYEAVIGVWIAEIAELSGFKGKEVESIKHFISSQGDRFRKAYGKKIEKHPRTSVFFPTTNENEFLTDLSGNRRFWPQKTNKERAKYPIEQLEKDRDQVFAEAVDIYRSGEKLYLDKAMETVAKAVQSSFTESDASFGDLDSFCDRKVPKSWYEMSLFERRNWISTEGDEADGMLRERISPAEVWVELMGKDLADLKPFVSRKINQTINKKVGWKYDSTVHRIKGYGVSRGCRREEL